VEDQLGADKAAIKTPIGYVSLFKHSLGLAVALFFHVPAVASSQGTLVILGTVGAYELMLFLRHTFCPTYIHQGKGLLTGHPKLLFEWT
jgi:hypothetical protein